MTVSLVWPPAMVAFAVTVALEPVVIAALRRGNVLDVPNTRSSHLSPIPRGGGIAVAVGVLAGLGFCPALARPPVTGLVIAGVAFGLVGLADDLRSRPALGRLGLQALAGWLALPWLLRGTTGPIAWRALFAIGVLLWLVAYVNAFNFMDGINGISAGQVTVAGIFWGVLGLAYDLPVLAVGGFILAAAAMGFVPYNFPRARVFLGDVGSYFFGACLAVLAVVGLRAGLPPEAVLAPLAVYSADTASTIVRRCRRRQCWHAAHRDHAYQRLVGSGLSHSTVTAVSVAAMVLTSLLGMVSLASSYLARSLADAVIVGVVVTYLASPGLVGRLSGLPAARWATDAFGDA